MKVIILAAGKGTRLAEFTNNHPKCLLKLGDETIIQREIRIIKECGIADKDIYVVGGYKYQELQDLVPNLIINTQYDVKDNSYTLGLALQTVYDDDVLVMDADLCFEHDLLKEVLNNHHENLLVSIKSLDQDESTGIVMEKDGSVKAIGKKYKSTGFVYISIFKIQKELIPEFRRLLLEKQSEKTWYPLAITNLCKKYKFYNHVTMCKWHEIDFIEDYYETLNMFNLN
jgi:choline kinase